MTITVIFIFLLLSALFSGTEIAFISASKLKVEIKKKKGALRGSIIAGFYDRPADFIGMLLVGNNIALVVFSYLMTQELSPLITKYLGFENAFLISFTNTIIITIVVLIFGEFLPKTLFRLYADEILYFLAYPLKLIQWLLSMPSWVMTRSSALLLRAVVRTPIEATESTFTRLDLENFINDPRTDSEEEIDKELFGNALNLKDTRVRDCMVPRTEIENIDVSASVEELILLFESTKLSRIIVTEGDTDNVLGYVHHQQLLELPKDIRSQIMDIPFVPEVMYATDLLNRFIKERLSIACVVDEFGSVSGIITLEDILEEIFGEIEDEYDHEDYIEKQISDNEFHFSGRLEIGYLNNKYNLNFPEGDYQTLSGYLVMTTETIPDQGAELELEGYRFIFEQVSNTKIETVRVIRLQEQV
jgi:CBS domain containing-hemolysin-like protein